MALANKEFDVTVVAVTHDLNHAVLESDRIIALREGELVFYGTPDLIMKPDVLQRIYGDSLLLVDHPQAGLADDRAAHDARTGEGTGQVAARRPGRRCDEPGLDDRILLACWPWRRCAGAVLRHGAHPAPRAVGRRATTTPRSISSGSCAFRAC